MKGAGPRASQAPGSRLQAPGSRLQAPGSTGGPPDDAAVCWSAVWHSLRITMRSSRPAGASPIDLENIAADVLMHAYLRFGAEPSCWDHVRRWCAVTAKHRRVDHWRRLRTQRLDASVALETLTDSVRAADPVAAPRAELPWAQELRHQLGNADRSTFDLLLAGVHDNVAIAHLRGRSVRAVELSRRRIAETAARLLEQGIFADSFVPERGSVCEAGAHGVRRRPSPSTSEIRRQ